jgi:N-acetylmuramoyl-L-alanine amidase
MFQTHTLNQSKTFGGVLLKHLQGVNHLKFATIQEAPLRVLKLPEIPSVLVEAAYISNPKEEKILKTPQFQTRIAEVVAKAIGEFLPPLPPVSEQVTDAKEEKQNKQDEKTQVEAIRAIIAAKAAGVSQTAYARPTVKNGYPAPEKDEERPPGRNEAIIYRVQRGDTLGKIARKHTTSVGALLALNHMQLRDPLYVNRMLKISGASEEKREQRGVKTPVPERKGLPADKKGRVIYRVKKGDTLAAIAKKHGITIPVLAKLNRLKLSKPLYVDRKLAIPGKPAP